MGQRELVLLAPLLPTLTARAQPVGRVIGVLSGLIGSSPMSVIAMRSRRQVGNHDDESEHQPAAQE